MTDENFSDYGDAIVWFMNLKDTADGLGKVGGLEDDPDEADLVFMTREEEEQVVEELISEEMEVLFKARKEYSPDKNIFANFVRIGDRLGLTPEKILLVYLLKHLDGIVSYVQGHEMQREDISGRITDARNYLLLLHLMVISQRSLEAPTVWG